MIAYRYNNHNRSGPWYVSNLKGKDGVDWGYSSKEEQAIQLNINQWKLFAKDMRECGTVAYSIPKV